MTTGKLFANLEDRTLRCPGDFPGGCFVQCSKFSNLASGISTSVGQPLCGVSAVAP